MLKEKAAQFNADPQIQEILAGINAVDPTLSPFFGKYSTAKAKSLKEITFNRNEISSVGLKYEKLDQLTINLLLGMR